MLRFVGMRRDGNGQRGVVRRETRRVTREQEGRILALRNHDYEQYLRLAQTAKDKRLRTLLEKTDSILEQLGLRVILPFPPLSLLLCHGAGSQHNWRTYGISLHFNLGPYISP